MGKFVGRGVDFTDTQKTILKHMGAAVPPVGALTALFYVAGDQAGIPRDLADVLTDPQTIKGGAYATAYALSHFNVRGHTLHAVGATALGFLTDVVYGGFTGNAIDGSPLPDGALTWGYVGQRAVLDSILGGVAYCAGRGTAHLADKILGGNTRLVRDR